MAGSIAQEMGHDLVIMYFIDKVIKGNKDLDIQFFIIHPGMGPAKDIHYWNPGHDEYTSGWDTSGSKFIPEYGLRYKIPEDAMKKLMEDSRYWEDQWYKKLSQELGKDLKQHVDVVCDSFESTLGKISPEVDKLPDFIGLNSKGEVTLIGEVKFESLAKKALEEVIAYQSLADKLKIPYYLIFPKKGTYATLEPKWVSENLPSQTNIYTFEEEDKDGKLKSIIVPDYKNLIFARWKK